MTEEEARDLLARVLAPDMLNQLQPLAEDDAWREYLESELASEESTKIRAFRLSGKPGSIIAVTQNACEVHIPGTWTHNTYRSLP